MSVAPARMLYDSRTQVEGKMASVAGAPLQLLVRAETSGAPHLALVENPQHQRPAQLEASAKNGRAPHMGSTALLKVAQLLMERNFTVARIEFDHPRLGPLSDEDAAETSALVIRALGQRGVNAAARIARSKNRLLITGIEFRAPDRTRAVLRRNGELIARPGSAMPEALPQIWPALEEFRAV